MIGLVVGVGVLSAVVLDGLPGRFRLESMSPSGDARVVGLRFQGSSPNALDGTLRLFVYRDEMDTRQQTTIPWSRDLRITWKEGSGAEAFVVEQNGHPQLEFQIHPSGIECSRGRELLAADPYE